MINNINGLIAISLMVEFNPDGSLKLPGQMAKAREENAEKMQKQRCIRIKKEILSFYSPKKCLLKIELSNAMNDGRFIDTIYSYFKEKSTSPTKMKKIDDRHFEIEIGTDFKRCSDCSSLINRYREFLDGNIIEEKGSCSYESQRRNFCEEDYFD